MLDREAEDACRVPHGRAASIRDLLSALARVLLIEILDHVLAPLVLEVDVDVGWLVALARDEALEEHFHARGIDRGDAEAVAHRGVGSRAAPLAEYPFAPREANDVPDDQEIPREPEPANHLELMLDLPAMGLRRENCIGTARTPALLRSLNYQSLEILIGGHPRR